MLKATLLATAVVTAAVGLVGTGGAAQAADYPYCAVAGGRNAYENCGYFTLRQCLASVSGVGGHCAENPRYFAYRPYGRYDNARSEPIYR
jgi:hypothetical protein